MSLNTSDSGQAFGLVIAAAGATAIGASAVFFPPLQKLATNTTLAVSLGFAAGVMLYVSLVDIYSKAIGGFEEQGHEEGKAFIYASLTFFAGILFMKILDALIHKLFGSSHPHVGDQVPIMASEDRTTQRASTASLPDSSADDGAIEISDSGSVDKSHGSDAACKKKLFSMGASTAAAIALHNFPEGLVTFVAYIDDPAVGIALAVGIAVHNIPEGFCVAMPIYYATGSKLKGFLWGCLSGVSEPLGALIGWLVLRSSFSGNVYGILFGLVAGIMVFISVDELLPTAFARDPHSKAVTPALVAGMFLISASLMLFSV